MKLLPMCLYGKISRTLFYCCVLFILTTVSCKKVFDIKPESQVDQSQAYGMYMMLTRL